jgi:CDP-glycerol glycerophosphotransferase (TagB/SpsB family)
LAQRFPHVRIDSPVLGSHGIPNYTTPADARSLASLFAHTDVFVTLFSTMVLESCFNDVPVVAAAFDPPASELEDFLPISEALDWPTHDRIIRSGAASVVRDPEALINAVRRYLEQPQLHSRERRDFAEQECTFVDGHCAERLADLIESLTRRPHITGAPRASRLRDRAVAIGFG